LAPGAVPGEGVVGVERVTGILRELFRGFWD